MDRKLCTLLLLLLCFSGMAQQAVITGKVIDSKAGNPLSGVAIVLRDQNQYTETNPEGTFKLSTNAVGNQVISVFLYGYKEEFVSVDLTGVKTLYIGTVRLTSEGSEPVAFFVDESQINDEDGSNQTIGNLSGGSDDIFLNAASYNFSPMRFNLRGYSQEFSSTYINGVSFNDSERGRFNYSMLGGMNPLFKNKEIVKYTGASNFSFGDLGGSTNILTRAAGMAQGTSVSLGATNRSYVLRGLVTYATGLMDNGWAFNGGLIYRWSKEGAWDGTFYNSFGYYLGAEKVFTPNHRLSLVTFGAPTQRGQQGAVTQEVYDLAESIYYNPYWGYQNGKKRNSRVVDSYDPTVVLSYEWKIDNKQRVNLGLGSHYNNYSSTALAFYNAPDPRPDYYRYLPSFYRRSFKDDNADGADDEMWDDEIADRLTRLWKTDTSVSQVNWDAMYNANAANNVVNPNGIAKYAVEKRHNDLFETTFNGVYNGNLTDNLKLTAGLEAKYAVGKHYKTMNDLLGGRQWIDIDQFAERDFGTGDIIQNDLNHPNQIIQEGDKFGYNYNINLFKTSAFAQNDWNYTHFDFYYAVQGTYTTFQREGFMRNGRAEVAKVQSYGRGKAYWFLDPSVKGGASYKPDGRNRISANILAEYRAPLANTAYLSPRIKDTRIPNLKAERVLSYDLNYDFMYRRLRGRISAFQTFIEGSAEINGYYDDSYRTFINHVMTDINKRFMGVEAAATFKINGSFALTGAGTWGDYRYMNNAIGVMSPENGSFTDLADRVMTKDLHVSTGPQVAASFAVDYTGPDMWFADITLSYFDKNYLDFAPIRFTESSMNDYTPEQKVALGTQEKLPNGFMLDASVGKVIYLNNRAQSLNFNLSLNNILNNRKMITGGYQQGRLPLSDGVIDMNSLNKFPNRYYYAQGFNLFLNIGYKF
ncbi:MAG: TonB-dependent receptor [Bacteroidales bacterium]